jgi:hypothetical protein
MFDSSFFRHGVGGRSLFGSPRQGAFEDKLVQSIVSLGNAVKMLSLGLDYRRYARFQQLTPPIDALPGKPGPRIHLDETDNWPPSQGDCQFCLEFAVDSALELQDVVFAKPSWRFGGFEG